ncbi:hypothetical protein TNCV_4402541 [Trichonephila clavipes]|uniref:Uncharacterized protein n=1 Tax=Trichonephila clavipes TaxID=2585209 RepID=A0A8X6V5H8_TRICX|nr:hypothetical protein TNCV_4402541 [Trichonephila clavipes]
MQGAADKGVYPLDPQPDAVVLYPGGTLERFCNVISTQLKQDYKTVIHIPLSGLPAHRTGYRKLATDGLPIRYVDTDIFFFLS